MHALFADWYSNAELSASHERLQLRWDAVENLGTSANAEVVIGLVGIAFGQPAESNAALESAKGKLVAAVKAKDNTFPSRGTDLELSVLAAAALAHVLTLQRTTAIVAALAVVSAHCQGVGRTPTVQDVIDLARKFLQEAGAKSRG
ncbi:MAG: hypothetical protein KIT58_09490, partial [Planctomycetota bacterium]|nr:hypothetical protein [Planctomycetota bacterium]